MPKINTDDAKLGFYGVGLQHEFTSLLPADKILPIAVSGVIGYTHLNGSYDFTDEGVISGEDQRLETKMNTWVFQAIVSTKLPIINFYGGLGYVTGKSEIDVLGTYSGGLLSSSGFYLLLCTLPSAIYVIADDGVSQGWSVMSYDGEHKHELAIVSVPRRLHPHCLSRHCCVICSSYYSRLAAITAALGDSASSSSDDSSQIIGNAPHIPPPSSQTHCGLFVG